MSSYIGKTYSLCPNNQTSQEYYNTIRKLSDYIIQKYPEYELDKFPNHIKKFKNKITNILKTSLSFYTSGVKEHLKNLSLLNRFDKTQRTKESNYHLNMLEIELYNRLYKTTFKNTSFKFALLPHCLRDFYPKCLSSTGEIEQICQGCNSNCYIHQSSQILKKYEIQPFISVTIDQVKLLKEVKRKYKNVGVLGIACIPELARGIKLAAHLGMQPLGLPLNANRCTRWMGKDYETSFNLKELETLIK